MKKLILIIAIFVVGSFCAEAQTITEYNQKAISSQSLTYDEYWNPIAQFTLKNLSNKTITNVEIVIYYNDIVVVIFFSLLQHVECQRQYIQERMAS